MCFRRIISSPNSWETSDSSYPINWKIVDVNVKDISLIFSIGAENVINVKLKYSIWLKISFFPIIFLIFKISGFSRILGFSSPSLPPDGPAHNAQCRPPNHVKRGWVPLVALQRITKNISCRKVCLYIWWIGMNELHNLLKLLCDKALIIATKE